MVDLCSKVVCQGLPKFKLAAQISYELLKILPDS
jgi:hypothetical protein